MAVEEGAGRSLPSELAARLRAGRSLVLFDNAEHLLPDLAAELAPLVSRAHASTFLITSRAPLQMDAEHEFPVPGMSAEDAELFVLSRAEAVGVGLERTPALASLCDRLDHLPLAMQLAVARLKMFSVDQLVQRLGSVLDLSGSRDADPRQRTLRTTIDWSYSLLGSEEKAAFRRLSVFSGSATVDAIEDVTATDPETLSRLLNQSLIRRQDDRLGPRFWMLGTIREFALERLEDTGDADAVRAPTPRTTGRWPSESPSTSTKLEAIGWSCWMRSSRTSDLLSRGASIAPTMRPPNPSPAHSACTGWTEVS